ncbi:MAG: hypothetical protein U1F43_15535 [Myxococcota bacterium]
MSDALPTKLTLTSKAIAEAEVEAGPRVDTAGEAVPPGQIMADLVAGGLAQRGWKVEYRWTTYSAHAFDAQRADTRYDVEVTLVDADSGAWTIVAKPRTGFFKRVFSSKVDANEHALLRHDIDAALAADARIASGGWAVDPNA